MTSIALWRYEARLAGKASLALPVTAALLVLAGYALLPPDGFLAAWMPGAVLPVAAGFAAVGVAVRDPAQELQRTLPPGYAVTLGRRLTLVALVTLLCLAVTGVRGLAAGGFAVLLCGVGVWAVARFGSGGAGSGVMLSCWLAKLLVMDTVVASTSVRFAALTVAGAVLLIRALRLIERKDT